VSYCRFSTDDYKCDIYLYEDAMGGWTTHVAGSRYVADTPIPTLPPGWWSLPVEEAMALNTAQMNWIKAARMEPIKLPSAGKSFRDGDLEQVIARLEGLRVEGFNFPDFVLTSLREDAAEGEQTP